MTNVPRILVFVTQHMATGGIESHLQEFCTHMAESGVLIDLVVLNSRMVEETKEQYLSACNSVFLGEQDTPAEKLFWLISTGLKLLSTSYKTLYTNGQGESIFLFQKMVRYKKWVHHHHTAGDVADRSTWGIQYLKVLKNAHHIIACSERNAGDLGEALRRKVDVVPCFSKSIQFTRNPNLLKPLRFGYFGRLIPEKGIDLICKLSNDPHLAGIEFHLWGEGEVYDVQFFKKYTNVYYHPPFQGREGLKSAIEKLDAFLLLSRHPEGLPICLLEVMSAGLPWIATNRGGVSDIACDPVATRVIPLDANYDQIKSSILSLAGDLQLGRISRDRLQNLYQKKFSAKAIVGNWTQILASGSSDKVKS